MAANRVIYLIHSHSGIFADRPPTEIPPGVVLLTAAECGTLAQLKDSDQFEQNPVLKEFLLTAPIPETEDGRRDYNMRLFEKGTGAEMGSGEGESLIASFPGELTPDAMASASAEFAFGGMKPGGIFHLYSDAANPRLTSTMIKNVALPFHPRDITQSFKNAVFPTAENVSRALAAPTARAPGALFTAPRNLVGRHTTFDRQTFQFTLSELFEDIKTGGHRFHIKTPDLAKNEYILIIWSGCRRFRVPKFTMSVPIDQRQPYDIFSKLLPIKKIAPNKNGNAVSRISVNAIPIADIFQQDEEGNTPLMAFIKNGKLAAAHRLLERLTDPETPDRPNERTVLRYIATRNLGGQTALAMAKRTSDGLLIHNLQTLSIPDYIIDLHNFPLRRNADDLQLERIQHTPINDLLTVTAYGLTYLMHLIKHEKCDTAAVLIDRLMRNAEQGNKPDGPTIMEYINRQDKDELKALDYAKKRCPSHKLLNILTMFNMSVSNYEKNVMVTTETNAAAEPFESKRKTVVDSTGNYYRIDGNKIVKATLAAAPNAELGGASVMQTTNRNTFRKFSDSTGELPPDTVVTVKVFAGNGEKGYKDGPVQCASFYDIKEIMMDKDILYIIDSSRIRIIEDGIVKTLAGTSRSGSNNGSGLGATFSNPSQLSINPAGELRVVDSDSKVRIIRRSKQAIEFLLHSIADPSLPISEFERLAVDLRYNFNFSLKESLEAHFMESLIDLIQMVRDTPAKCELTVLLLDRFIYDNIIRKVNNKYGILTKTYTTDKIVDDKTLVDLLNIPIQRGIIPTLKELFLRYPESPDFVQYGVACVSYLSYSPAAAQAIVEIDIIDILKKLRFDFLDYPYMCSSIADLFGILSTSEEGKAYFNAQNSEDVRGLVMALLNKNNTNLITNCLIFLTNMVKDAAAPNFTDELVAKVNSILSIHGKDKDIAYNGPKYLSTGRLTDPQKELLVAGGIFLSLLTIFENFGKEVEICENVCVLLAALTTTEPAHVQSRPLIPFLIQCLSTHAKSLIICQNISQTLLNISRTHREWVVGAELALRAALAEHIDGGCPVAETLLGEIGTSGRVNYKLGAANRANLEELGLNQVNAAVRGAAMPAIKRIAERTSDNFKAIQAATGAYGATRRHNANLFPLEPRVGAEGGHRTRKGKKQTARRRTIKIHKNIRNRKSRKIRH